MTRRKPMMEELDRAIRDHLERETQDNIERGMSPEEARYAAVRKFGNLTRIKEAAWEVWSVVWLDQLLQDVRFGLRMLRKSPGFTAAAVLTLALGIGANTAIFSLVNTLMLKSLPYSHPERMGTIYTRVTGSRPSDERHHLNGEQWELLRDNVPSLMSAVSGIRASGGNLQAGSQVRYLHAGRISAHYLDVLGSHPLIGRNFSDAEGSSWV